MIPENCNLDPTGVLKRLAKKHNAKISFYSVINALKSRLIFKTLAEEKLLFNWFQQNKHHYFPLFYPEIKIFVKTERIRLADILQWGPEKNTNYELEGLIEDNLVISDIGPDFFVPKSNLMRFNFNYLKKF